MARMIIDFWMDGYDSEEEMLEAIPEYLDDLLSSSGTSFKFVKIIDPKEAGERDDMVKPD
jgi:hypothetical protein